MLDYRSVNKNTQRNVTTSSACQMVDPIENRVTTTWHGCQLQTVAGNHTNLHTPKNRKKQQQNPVLTIPPSGLQKMLFPKDHPKIRAKSSGGKDSDSCSRKVENCGDKNPRSGNAGCWLPGMPSTEFFHVLEFRICNLFQKHLPQRIKPPPHLATAIEFRQKLLRHTEWIRMGIPLFISFLFFQLFLKKKQHNTTLFYQGFWRVFLPCLRSKNFLNFSPCKPLTSKSWNTRTNCHRIAWQRLRLWRNPALVEVGREYQY